MGSLVDPILVMGYNKNNYLEKFYKREVLYWVMMVCLMISCMFKNKKDTDKFIEQLLTKLLNIASPAPLYEQLEIVKEAKPS